jgi:hypothetical protein
MKSENKVNRSEILIWFSDDCHHKTEVPVTISDNRGKNTSFFSTMMNTIITYDKSVVDKLH